jgi:hypothetical protein
MKTSDSEIDNQSQKVIAGIAKNLESQNGKFEKYPFLQQVNLAELCGVRPLIFIGQYNCELIVSKDVKQLDDDATNLSRN